MATASFVVVPEAGFYDTMWRDAAAAVAGIVSRLFSQATQTAVLVMAADTHDLGAEVASLVEIVGEFLPVTHEGRLARLAELGYSSMEVERTFAAVESWMQGGVRRDVIRLGPIVDAGKAESRAAFREWFESGPADALLLGVLKADVRQPGLALAYAVSELCDELWAARELGLVRQTVPDWGSVAFDGMEDDCGRRVDGDAFELEVESWPAY